jgi:alkylation response protein AidB-like acyl-CoA dehydrogenase
MFTNEQMEIRDMVRKFARAEIVPHIMEWDEAGQAPPHIWKAIGEMGLYGMCAPTEWGGSDSGIVAWAMAVEELSYADIAIGNQVGGQSFPFVAKLVQHGTQRQKEEFLRPLLRGDHYSALLFSEPHAGSDLSTVRTTGVKRGDKWIINGSKVLISGGDTSGVALLLASTNPAAGKKGLTTFLIRPHQPGYNIIRREKKLGLRVMDNCQISLDDMEVPEENVLGQPGAGYKMVLEGLDTNRVGVAAQGVGVSQAAYDLALRYSKEREAFGKKLIEHQALGFRLAEMATRIHAARQLYLHAARLKEEGRTRVVEASMAKLFATETAEWVCTNALQIFGGYGFIQGNMVEKLYRDQRVLQLYEGTNEMLKMIIHRDARDAA